MTLMPLIYNLYPLAELKALTEHIEKEIQTAEDKSIPVGGIKSAHT